MAAPFTKKEANHIVGGLSKAGKMPCPSFSLSAYDCKTGGRLSDVSWSVCSGCYAKQGNYRWRPVQLAYQRRLGHLNYALSSDRARRQYIEAFAVLLKNQDFFRWFDSGDVQSLEHLALIYDVALRCHWVNFWLPTKEYKLVRRLKRPVPDNLTVRVSAPMIDQRPLDFPHTSTVHWREKPEGDTCPASLQIGGQCGECRKCWDKTVSNVSYKYHGPNLERKQCKS